MRSRATSYTHLSDPKAGTMEDERPTSKVSGVDNTNLLLEVPKGPLSKVKEPYADPGSDAAAEHF